MFLTKREQQVLDFQTKYGSTKPGHLSDGPLYYEANARLLGLAEMLFTAEKGLAETRTAMPDDPRILRASLAGPCSW